MWGVACGMWGHVWGITTSTAEAEGRGRGGERAKTTKHVGLYGAKDAVFFCDGNGERTPLKAPRTEAAVRERQIISCSRIA